MNLDTLDALIGDVPVSEQISMALAHVSSIDHTHDNYATRDEVEELKQKINVLIDLVGDTPISEQIHMALKNIK